MIRTRRLYPVYRPSQRLLLAAALLVCASSDLHGQTAPPDQTAPLLSPRSEERVRREAELAGLEGRLRDSEATRGRLSQELAALRAEAERLGTELVAAGQEVRALDDRVSEIETQIQVSGGREASLRALLDSRRDRLAEILAALVRAGHHAAVVGSHAPGQDRSPAEAARLIGALSTSLAEEAGALAAAGRELAVQRDSQLAQRAALLATKARQEGARGRLADLLEARRRQARENEAALRAETERADRIAGEARSLGTLVDRLAAEALADARSRDAADRVADAKARLVRERLASVAGREPPPLSPRLPFAKLTGTLSRPASGTVLQRFGDPDGRGGSARGIVIGTRARALVTAPADARVVYAGPFRSYGRLLILDAGDGYYVLLSGLDQISVETGRFVLAGEPVGQMGETASSSAASAAVEASGPTLYVEFRKDSGSIDPAPWWAKSQGEKVRG